MIVSLFFLHTSQKARLQLKTFSNLTSLLNPKMISFTVWNVSIYGVFSCPYFPAFGLNAEYLSVFCPNLVKYGPEKTPYLDTFHAVFSSKNRSLMKQFKCSFPITLASDMSLRYSEATIFFNLDFLVELNAKRFLYSLISISYYLKLSSILVLHYQL